ncbi:MAG: DUF2442 domain-containing protein [Ignavibacteria bacterium]|jgi:hypothetical protein|nr:DUF2442 domain-containing protein [Ignavibacteria bacterium]
MNIYVTNAEYIDRYNIKVSFNDGTSQVVDFGKFLLEYPHPQYNKYKDLERFKEFRIDSGELVWGKDWDLSFHTASLYNNDLFNNYE